MSENTEEKPNPHFDIQEPKLSAKDEVESAKILVSEGLWDEAKRILHRVLISNPSYARAQSLLKEIQKTELDQILNRSQPSGSSGRRLDDPSRVLQRLERDLGIDFSANEHGMDPKQENWFHQTELSSIEGFDLAIAFFEMGCFRDCVRELELALKKVRVQETVLDDHGVAIVALKAEALLLMGEAFDAKVFLAEILIEPEISHESKLPLYYLAGRCEEALGWEGEARAWYLKVIEIDPMFRDANFRIRVL